VPEPLFDRREGHAERGELAHGGGFKFSALAGTLIAQGSTAARRKRSRGCWQVPEIS
jgi:hypothetical protein